MLTDGVEAYYKSQLAALPDKDDTWPSQACGQAMIDPQAVRRIATPTVAA